METKFGKWITSRGFPIVFLTILLTATWYMGLRMGDAVSWLWGWNWYIPIFGFLLAMIVILGYSQNAGVGRRFDRSCKRISAYFLCFLLYDVLALIVFDLAGLIFRLDRMVRSRLILAAAALAVLIILYGAVHARRLKTVQYPLELDIQGNGVRVVLLSDLHIGIFVGSKYLSRMVEEINRLEPDLVVISGDLFDGCLPADDKVLKEAAAVFRTIQAPEGIYAVIGNHDPDASDERFRRFLIDAHIRLLYNEAVELPAINLIGRAGIVDMKEVRAPLKDLMPEQACGKPTVVLDHDPQGIREAAEHGADLVLCGHTHKGQFFPMDLLTCLANGREYFYGYGKKGRTQSVICAGTGFFQLPIRVGTDSEIVIVDIRATGTET